MINRGLSKTSAYVFNADTGMLEKKDPQTIESLSKQLNQSINNLEDIPANKTEDIEPNNNIVVITADDNLIHNYFYDLDVSWDSSNCLSTAIIKMPKMNTENTNYWATYQGQLTIYIGHNFTFDYVNNNKFSNEQDAANSLSKYWDNSNIKPFFRGEVARIKEFQSEITIYVDSIGRRFQQKIPEEFRQSYIYNQNVRDAFQAICEFLGVQHICPPQTVTDNGETTEEAEEDGGKSDADTKVQQEQQISSQVRNIVQSGTDNENNDDEDSEENTDDANLTNNEEITKPMDGYGNVNFDANGSIVYGSKVIETSPDMAETLLAMEENPLEKYIEDETGIIEKVKAFLDGDMFEELHNKVMNYDAITIEPKSASSSSASSTGTDTTSTSDTDSNSEEESDSESSNRSNNSNKSNKSNKKKSSPKNGWHNGQLYKNGKIYLSPNYIWGLSSKQAIQKLKTGKNTYTTDTIKRLRRRAVGLRW